MPTEVKMPQMGESIYEGTITKWLKKVGDSIRQDEPIYELSTDKIDTEIPSPVSGTLVEIRVQEGEKAPIHSVVALVDESGAAASPQAEKKVEARAPAREVVKAPPAPRPQPAVASARSNGGNGDGDGHERVFASPLVRRIAREEGVDLADLKGSGWKGRITKQDILDHLGRRKVPVAAPVPEPPPPPAVPSPPPAPARPEAGDVQTVPMSPMRQKISEHMVFSRRTSAHVTTVFEVDMTRIARLRDREKADYERVYGTKLTFTPFFAMAAVQAIKDFPILNASVDGSNILSMRDINLGIAVALPDGLIVPVVHHAEEKSFLGLCRAINDVAERARNRKLAVHEVQGGTFTITNPGIYGGLFGTPIINQPQVAIMGVGGLEKRPVVIDDAIAVRWMCYLALSFDHRVIDGAVADQFMAKVKENLENWKTPIK